MKYVYTKDVFKNKKNGFHRSCFERVKWWDALHILKGTVEVQHKKTKTNVAGWYQTMDTTEYLW